VTKRRTAKQHRTVLPAQRQNADDPPLAVTETGQKNARKGPISVRWLTGAVLTGMAGAALIGGALYSSIDRSIALTSPPDAWRVAEAPDGIGLGDRNASTAKSDKLDLAAQSRAERKVIQSTKTENVDNKEFISIKPFELVTVPLAQFRSELSDGLPAFNPLALFAEQGVYGGGTEERPVDAETLNSEAVSITYSAFDRNVVFADDFGVTEQEIARAVQASVPFDVSFEAPFRLPAIPESLATGTGIATIVQQDNGAQSETPADAPGNRTNLVKTVRTYGADDANDIRVLSVSAGDDVTELLINEGIAPADAEAAALTLKEKLGTAPRGEHALRLSLHVPEAAAPPSLIHLAVLDGSDVVANVARTRAGGYVAISNSAAASWVNAAGAAAGGAQASIYHGLFEAGMRNGIPRTILNELVRIHAYDTDFQKPVAPGDSFTAFFEAPEPGTLSDPTPLFISMTIRGDIKAFYRFRTPDDGVVDYYDSSGQSAKKFLVRKPMNGGRFRSGFGMRKHPILRYRRMHTGVDWSAPRGTPIVAAGNGTVVEAEWKSGYGRWVKLRHANGYETNYAHMSNWAKGITPGARVRQGQVIGYIGSSGLSTGPHLHYEVQVNGRHVDPLRIRLPRGRTLDGEMLAQFDIERTRIDGLMRQPGAQPTLSGRFPEIPETANAGSLTEIARR